MRDNAKKAGSNWTILGILSIVLMGLCWLPLEAAERPDRPAENSTIRQEKQEALGTIMILGLGWHSGFCEGRPDTPECKNQAHNDVSARQFSLTGLWRIRKTYCGVPDALQAQDKARKWLDMPELALDAPLKAELVEAMPGMASGLERHEWIKHGTCSGEVAADYYARSLKMLADVNGSAVQALFEANLGGRVTEADVKAAFATAFGAGAGDKIRMRCRKDGERQVITGLTIGLGDLDGDDLAASIAAAGKTRFGCAEGIVDRAGLQ